MRLRKHAAVARFGRTERAHRIEQMTEGDTAQAGTDTVQKLAPAQTGGGEWPCARMRFHCRHLFVTNSSWLISALASTVVAATSVEGRARSRGRSPVSRNFSAAPGLSAK